MKCAYKGYPFAAVLGQNMAKNALIWNAVNPRIGGVLISGEKGTAKSTLARGLAAVARDIGIVELPLNVTEDRLIGNIDFERAVKYGERKFEPGLLAQADGNILYVDEVNLLGDHIVKALLEAASSGVNIVEREGVSYRHPSRFILVGTMNPEEGGLRPQFLDRFGLFVEAAGEHDIGMRAEIVRRRIAFERDPSAFAERWRQAGEKLAESIRRARKTMPYVEAPVDAVEAAAEIARLACCAGHRAELAIVETAKAIAAMDERIYITTADVEEAAYYALPHRAGGKPEMPEENPGTENGGRRGEQNEGGAETRGQAEQQQKKRGPMPSEEAEKTDEADSTGNPEDGEEWKEGGRPGSAETVFAPGHVFKVGRWLDDDKRSRLVKKGGGKRKYAVAAGKEGRYVKYAFPSGNDYRDIAMDATLRAAAPYQQFRQKDGLAVSIAKSDIRVKVRERRVGNTIVFVVDASGSMNANMQMYAVKGAVLSLLHDAYQKRDRVSLIAFRAHSAQLLLDITRSVDLARKKLADLPTGGITPIAAGLDLAFEVVKAARAKDRELCPVIVLVTDGKATYSAGGMDPFEDALRAASRISAENIKSIVLDTDVSYIRLEMAEKLAKAMNADHFKIENLHADAVLAAVSAALG